MLGNRFFYPQVRAARKVAGRKLFALFLTRGCCWRSLSYAPLDIWSSLYAQHFMSALLIVSVVGGCVRFRCCRSCQTTFPTEKCCIMLYMCPHTAMYVSSYRYMCVQISMLSQLSGNLSYREMLSRAHRTSFAFGALGIALGMSLVTAFVGTLPYTVWYWCVAAMWACAFKAYGM